MQQDKKVAIVCSGGGTRSAYAVGVLRALAKEYHFTKPDIGVASSGGASPLLFYLTGQYTAMLEWADLFDDSRFINLFRFWRMVNVDFLVDGILKKQVPDLCRRLADVDCDYYIATTRVRDARPYWFNKTSRGECFEIIRASAAIVIAYGKKILINNTYYVDGSFTTGNNLMIKKAFEKGADIVILIDNSARPERHVKIRRFFRIVEWFQPSETANIIKVFRTRAPCALSKEQNEKVIRIEPSGGLLMHHTLTRMSKRLHKTIKLGYNDCVDNKQLRELFSEKCKVVS